MYEENRRISWTNLFIKVIIIIIFILFTIWLLSLANRGVSKKVDVLTDSVYSQNMEKMQNVGKEYFTTARLPQNVGDVKVLTLDKMYEKKLLLELTDKNGRSCSAKNSYVSVEKLEDEYQMKVYLDCGGKKDYIVTIMGCYNYCDTDICERKEDKKEENNDKEEKVVKDIEYEYVKTTGGSLGPWGSFSKWSTTSVTKTDYRDVETKIVVEPYTYDKTTTDTKYMGEATCASISGYTLTSNTNGKCTYTKTTTDTKKPSCPSVSGYTLTSQDGFTCSYSKSTTSTADPTCPSVSGYTLSSRSGFTCNYSKNTTSTANPTCPSVSGYTLTSRDGFTCSYSKSTTTTATATCPSGYTKSGSSCAKTTSSTTTANPTCPSVSGYTYTGRSGFTCNYSKTTTSSSYTLSYYGSGSGSYVPSDTSTYHYVQTSSDYQYKCDSSCGYQWYYTYKIYKKVYGTTTTMTTKSATCPSGYTQSGSTCAKTTSSTVTANPSCPSVSGYTFTSRSGFTCNYSGTSITSKTATCPSGYTKSGSSCSKTTTSTTTSTATCPSGYSKSGSSCSKTTTSITSKTATCPSEYTQSGSNCAKKVTESKATNATCATGEYMKSGKCYKDITTTTKINGTKDVTYYRYRTRSYVGGTTVYKWSSSNNDKSLLDAGYKLTGKTREKQVGGK